MTFDHRVGHPGSMLKTHRKRAADSGCTNGGFYKSPSSGQSIQSGTNFNISWDTTCLTASAVDIYLYAPGSNSSRIHIWQNVNYGLGSYSSELSAGWWNSTSSISLQLSIVESGTLPFLSTLPAGPVFTATVGPGDKSTSTSSTIEDVNNFGSTHAGLSKGQIAAAVILPLLAVGGLIIAAWVKFNHAKTESKRKRWSEAVDKRMSTISTDWKSISAAGASAAIRNSMAVSGTSGNRNSAFSFGNIRPSSTIALEGGQAGVGSKGMYMHDNGSFEQPQMSQLRPNARFSAADRTTRVSFAADTRVSRVSFATDTRPSMDSRRGVSRAFHFADVPVPPLPQPARKDSSELSPTQTNGPLSLTADDIRARMSGQSESRPSIDDYMPALSMMRHGGDGGANDNDLLFAPQEPTPPTPTVPKSSVVGIMPMQPMPANVMSPDDMLRAYAESRRAMGAPGNGGPAFPSPALSYDGNGMRTLYSPPPSAPVATSNPYRMTRPVSEYSRYDDEDAYVGTAG